MNRTRKKHNAAGITAVPVAGGVALFGLSPAGRGRRGGPRHHGTDRPAVSGPALLRLAPDGGVAGNPGSLGQSQAGPAADAADGAGGDLPAPEHEQAGSGAQDLSLPPRRDLDRAGQSGVVLGRHLHPRRGTVYIPLPNGFLYPFALNALVT